MSEENGKVCCNCRHCIREFDADALKKEVEKESNHDGSYGYMDAKSIVDLIEDAPTIEPERKKGKWIGRSEDERNPIVRIECSECGEALSWKANYYPNCGADMRGEQG